MRLHPLHGLMTRAIEALVLSRRLAWVVLWVWLATPAAITVAAAITAPQAWAAADAADDRVLRLTQAEFAPGDEIGLGRVPAPPAQGWRPVVIPDIFAEEPQPNGRIGWYRLRFQLDDLPPEPLVLLVQRVVLTAEFRLNGSLLNAGVRFQEPGGPAGTLMLNRPQWLVLSPGLFRVGQNELLIRLSGDRLTPAWISNISIGPAEALRAEFALRDIPQHALPQAMFVLLLAALLVGARVWWREKLPLQGYLLATGLLWLAQLGMYLWPDLPVPWRTGVALTVLLWIAFHWALFNLLWRLAEKPWRWFSQALLVGSVVPLVASAGVLLFEPTASYLGLLMLPTIVLRTLTTVMLLGWAWRERSWAATLLTGCELLWFIGPVQLMLVAMDLIPPDPFMLSPASGMPLFLVLLLLAAQRLAQQRENAYRLRQAAVDEERQRLILDMHDGVGSQLVAALRMARREDVPRTDLALMIETALTDLRLVIEAQDHSAQELRSLLQQWQQRLLHRVDVPGLAWDIQELTAPRSLTPRESVHILRILQEALNNAVQHAGAANICIALTAVPGANQLMVSDDGRGWTDAHSARPSRGRGLTGMQHRAASIGGRLDIYPNPNGGTVVRLLLPQSV